MEHSEHWFILYRNLSYVPIMDMKLLCVNVLAAQLPTCRRRYFCMAIGDATFLFPLSIWAAAIYDDDNAT